MAELVLAAENRDAGLGNRIRSLLAPDRPVRSYRIREDPFDYPSFGRKRFTEVEVSFADGLEPAEVRCVLKRLPDKDAVQALTGVTEHREVALIREHIVPELADALAIPYLGTLDDSTVVMRHVGEELAAFAPTGVIPPSTLRQLLSALARMHARYWERHPLVQAPWLMRLPAVLERCFRCFRELIAGSSGDELAMYVAAEWPWLQDGLRRLLQALPPSDRRLMLRLLDDPSIIAVGIDSQPQTLCHFDFDVRNVGWSGALGKPVVIDGEMAGAASSACDVARLLTSQRLGGDQQWIQFYFDRLEEALGEKVERAGWQEAYELSRIAAWSLFGVVFASVVNTPASPFPDALKNVLRPQALSDAREIADALRLRM
jgi:hypothetical protein